MWGVIPILGNLHMTIWFLLFVGHLISEMIQPSATDHFGGSGLVRLREEILGARIYSETMDFQWFFTIELMVFEWCLPVNYKGYCKLSHPFLMKSWEKKSQELQFR